MKGVSIPTKKPPQSKISATVVADSITRHGHRITTMALVMPRMILAEFNTHRMFTRNSASSRAIPTHKMIEAVKTDPFVPMKFLKEHSGMQGYVYLDPDEEFWARKAWIISSEYMINQAQILTEKYKVSKQFANRLLEPFMWHKVLVTATNYENFFALRYHGTAEIHMQTLAMQMLLAMNSSTPHLLQPGQWHIPFGDDINESKLADAIHQHHPMDKYTQWEHKYRIMIATARAARISYTLPSSIEKHDYVRDVDMHNMLANNGHWSPLEHSAQAPEDDELCPRLQNVGIASPDQVQKYLIANPEHGWWGNFRGWKQYRKMFQNENRSDNRLNKRHG